MKPYEIKKGIYWVGVVDWNVRTFHGHTYTTKRGTTYNAYLIIDDKITLVDTVYGPFADEMLEKIAHIVPAEKIDYIIANHVETDHSGALPALMRRCPGAKVFGTEKCRDGLYKNYYGKWEFKTVKTGDTLSLGRRSLSFIEAPMIHWPDSMFTYCPQEKLLLPNDAFGQHYATSERFDDEVDNSILMEEATKYYANILWPLGSVIARKIEEVKKLNIPIDMIAPSHGIIWRKDPFKIIDAYVQWAGNTTKEKVAVVYETMWGATEKMARRMAEGIIDAGVGVTLFDVNLSDRTEIISEMLDTKGFLFGSSTHDNDMLPGMAGFLEFLKGLKAKNRIASAFGSYGWGGGATQEIEKVLLESGIAVTQPPLSVKYMPDENELTRCYEFGTAFAQAVKKGGSDGSR